MKILGVVVVLITSIGVIWAVTKSAKHYQAQQDPQLFRADPGTRLTIASIAKKAKVKGITKVNLPVPEDRQAVVRDFNDAVSRHTIVIAQQVDRTSLVTDPLSLNIETFYKLKIVDNISVASTPCCDSNTDIPETLPQLGENEIYLRGIGGTVVVDDVEFTQEEFIGQLLPDQNYLLFLSDGSPSKLASLHLGPRGIYKVDASGQIETDAKEMNPIKNAIDRDFNGSLVKFKERAKSFHRKR
jgi:hypothetical protein